MPRIICVAVPARCASARLWRSTQTTTESTISIAASASFTHAESTASTLRCIWSYAWRLRKFLFATRRAGSMHTGRGVLCTVLVFPRAPLSLTWIRIVESAGPDGTAMSMGF